MFDLLLIAGSSFVIYVFVLTMLRVFGRRQLAQLSILDLVVVVTLGSAVETSLIRGDVSLPAGLTSAATLLATNAGLAAVTRRSKRLRRIVGGGPLLLINHGEVVAPHLKRIGMTDADLCEALRQHEFQTPAEVRFAVLETDGSVSVVPYPADGANPPVAAAEVGPKS